MTGKTFNMWIIDSGATNHMTGNPEQLSSLQRIPAVNIGLPDGDQVVASARGRANLNPNLALNNVLYVPQFSCDLMSIDHVRYPL